MSVLRVVTSFPAGDIPLECARVFEPDVNVDRDLVALAQNEFRCIADMSEAAREAAKQVEPGLTRD
jgi:hypothetical protein